MYEAYTKFKNFKKTEAISMLDYIVEFEQLNKKCTNLKIDTDSLLALKVLYNSNLSEQQIQLALTASPQIKNETMKHVLTRVFTTELQINNEVEVKEQTMITEKLGDLSIEEQDTKDAVEGALVETLEEWILYLMEL